MIWIKYKITLSNNIIQSNLRFDNLHEENFKLMYSDVMNHINTNIRIDLKQYVVYCSYHIVKLLRKTINNKQERILETADNAKVHCHELRNAEQIDCEIVVDTLPKKLFTIFRRDSLIAT